MLEHPSFFRHRAEIVLGCAITVLTAMTCHLQTAIGWTPSTARLFRRVPISELIVPSIFPVVAAHPLHRPYLSVSELYSVTDNGEGGIDEGMDDPSVPRNPLARAGAHMRHIDGPVGNALIAAGRAWSSDWALVTESLGDASAALLLMTVGEVGCTDGDHPESKSLSNLRPLWEAMALELQDASTIEGCSSVGPPASVPNWIAIQALLEDAVAEATDSQPRTDEWTNECPLDVYSILEMTRKEINDLIATI